MGRTKQYVNQIWFTYWKGGVFGPDILNHFSNVKYLALAQGRTGSFPILPPPQKGPTWPRDVFFERGPLRRAGVRRAVLALAGRAAHRRVPDAAARAPATPAVSGARV